MPKNSKITIFYRVITMLGFRLSFKIETWLGLWDRGRGRGWAWVLGSSRLALGFRLG